MEKLLLAIGLMVCFTFQAEAILYKMFGCYKDDNASPQLNGKEITLTSMNVRDCAKGCNSAGFPYMGIMAGARCLCGNEYGQLGTVPIADCNYTCPTYSGSATNEMCGGPDVSSVFYASDSDPVTRVDRVFLVYPGPLSWLDARHDCIKRNGDLAILGGYAEVNYVKGLTNTTAGISGPNVWVGLFKMSHLTNADFTWTDQTSYSLDPARYWDGAANTFDTTKLCVYLNTVTLTLMPTACSTTMPFICKQIPNPDVTTASSNTAAGSAADSGDGLSEDEKRRNRVLLYVLLPIFILCYGGSCMVYIIGKVWKNLKMKRKNLQMQAAFEEEYEPDTKPIMGAMHQQNPPAYYKGPMNEENKYRGRQKIYNHEMEPQEQKEDEIDFSKLSIQDIIYIKSLMGERHSAPEGKKRKILVA